MADIREVRLSEGVEQKAVTVSEIIERCKEAAMGMSAHNPNRNLLMNAAYALRQLVDRLDRYEGSGVLPGPEEPQ